jgi:secretion/DNA translocation related TadE-like protein
MKGRPGDERGAGAVLAIAIVAATTVVLVAVLALGAALVLRQRVIGAADAAALAAADGASGAVAGVPCGLAERVADANRAALTSCTLDGLIASVTVSATFGALSFSARSTAGPPP